MVIAVAQLKGGVGKSALAVNLSHAFSARASVLLIDADARNRTASDTFPEVPFTLYDVLSGGVAIEDASQQVRAGLHLLAADERLLTRDGELLWSRLPQIFECAAVVVVDCAAGWSGAAPVASQAAVCLLPFKADAADVSSAQKTLAAIESNGNGKPTVRGVRMAWEKNELSEWMNGEFTGADFPLCVMETIIPRARPFPALVARCQTVFDEPDGSLPHWQRAQRKAYLSLSDELLGG